MLYPPYSKFIYDLNTDFKEITFDLLLSFVAKITKTKLAINPLIIEKIFTFIENNFCFEKNLRIINIINKSI